MTNKDVYIWDQLPQDSINFSLCEMWDGHFERVLK